MPDGQLLSSGHDVSDPVPRRHLRRCRACEHRHGGLRDVPSRAVLPYRHHEQREPARVPGGPLLPARVVIPDSLPGGHALAVPPGDDACHVPHLPGGVLLPRGRGRCHAELMPTRLLLPSRHWVRFRERMPDRNVQRRFAAHHCIPVHAVPARIQLPVHRLDGAAAVPCWHVPGGVRLIRVRRVRGRVELPAHRSHDIPRHNLRCRPLLPQRHRVADEQPVPRWVLHVPNQPSGKRRVRGLLAWILLPCWHRVRAVKSATLRDGALLPRRA
jgi:hypothetical protein